jgi:hypothetical protein
MSLVVEQDKGADPPDVRLFRPWAVMSQPDRLPHLIEEFRRLRHDRPRIGAREVCAIGDTPKILLGFVGEGRFGTMHERGKLQELHYSARCIPKQPDRQTPLFLRKRCGVFRGGDWRKRYFLLSSS